MEKFKLNVHSVIDLITNSSTEMFVDYSGSIEPVKELVNEFLKAEGSTLHCDDIFEIKLIDTYTDEEWDEDSEGPSEIQFTVINEKYENLAKLIEGVLFSAETREYMC